MTDSLNDESIDGWLKGRKGWKRSGNALTKDFQFPSFRDAIIFVNRVASLADDLDHHPDIDIRYTTVCLTLTTHSADGLRRRSEAGRRRRLRDLGALERLVGGAPYLCRASLMVSTRQVMPKSTCASADNAGGAISTTSP